RARPEKTARGTHDLCSDAGTLQSAGKSRSWIHMLRVNPFAALRPKPNLAADVASVPYDVVDTDEARRLAEGRPLSFLHVVRSEIDLPADTDPHADVVYQRALENLRALERDALIRESTPSV